MNVGFFLQELPSLSIVCRPGLYASLCCKWSVSNLYPISFSKPNRPNARHWLVAEFFI